MNYPEYSAMPDASLSVAADNLESSLRYYDAAEGEQYFREQDARNECQWRLRAIRAEQRFRIEAPAMVGSAS